MFKHIKEASSDKKRLKTVMKTIRDILDYSLTGLVDPLIIARVFDIKEEVKVLSGISAHLETENTLTKKRADLDHIEKELDQLKINAKSSCYCKRCGCENVQIMQRSVNINFSIRYAICNRCRSLLGMEEVDV